MRILLACLLLSIAVSPAAAAINDWSEPSRPALIAYTQGNWELARQLAAGLRGAGDEARADGAAIEAMVTLRTADRKDRMTARAALANQLKTHPDLLQRPEVLFAFGLTQQFLNEYSTAVEYLDAAARAFAAERSPRAIEAWVALAEVWRDFNEWEYLPAQFQVAPPANAEAAHQLRLERIDALRSQAEAAGTPTATIARLDFVAGAARLDHPSTSDQGRAALEALSGGPAAARADLELGRYFGRGGRSPEAIAALRRAADAGVPEIAEQARAALRELAAPRLELVAPQSPRPDQPFGVDVKTRNLTQVEVELREVRLGDWLAGRSPRSRAPRMDVDALPITGALVFQTRIDIDAPAHAEWRAADHAPISAQAPAGAYVLIATGRTSESTTITARALVIVSELRAAIVIGADHVAIVAHAPAGAEPIHARFWAQTAIAAARRTLEDGAVVFELPAEFQRPDKRWVCLVESGNHVALFTGAISREQARPKCALSAVTVKPDDRTARVVGLALNPDGTPYNGPVSVDWRDAADVSRHVAQAEARGGFFSAEMPLRAADFDKSFSIIAAVNRAILETIGFPAITRTPVVDPSQFDASVALPPQRPSDADARVQLEARFPAGEPLVDAELHSGLRGLRFDPTGAAPPYLTVTASLELATGGHGLSNAEVAPAALDADAVQVEGALQDATRRNVRVVSDAIWIDPPVAVWFERTPPATVGLPIRFEVGWHAPTDVRPVDMTVRVMRADAECARMPVREHAMTGFTPLWTPVESGRHEAVLTARLSDDRMVEARAAFIVNDSPGAYVTSSSVGSDASASPEIQIALNGRFDGPLALISGGAEPYWAQVVTPGDVVSQLTFQAPIEGGADRHQLVAIALEANGPRPIFVDRRPPAAPTAALEVTMARREEARCVKIECGDKAGAALIRMVSADARGTLRWTPGPLPPVRSGEPGWEISIPAAEASRPLLAPPLLSDDVAEALFAGETMWATVAEWSEGEPEKTVELPELPGAWRVYVVLSQLGELTAHRLPEFENALDFPLIAPIAAQRGDRFIVSARLPRADGPVSTRVTTNGVFLDSEVWRWTPAGAIRLPGDLRGQPPQSLPSVAGDARLLFRAEAVNAGTATITVTAEDRDSSPVSRATATITISDPPAPTERPDVSVQRELRLMREEFVDAAELGGARVDSERAQRVWRAEVLPPDARISLGDVILVRDRFTTTDPHEQLEWTQTLPANCATWSAPFEDATPIGKSAELGWQHQRFESPRLSPGDHIHEFVMVAVRPGVCALPAPRLHANNREITVSVEPRCSIATPWPAAAD